LNKYEVAEKIHKEVNEQLIYKTDLKRHGVADYWDNTVKYGDCEDYALTKRKKLMEAGWDIDKIGICLCLTENNEGHCVLYVDTDRGAYILDNMEPLPVKPLSLPYKWSRMLCKDGWRQLLSWLP